MLGIGIPKFRLSDFKKQNTVTFDLFRVPSATVTVDVEAAKKLEADLSHRASAHFHWLSYSELEFTGTLGAGIVFHISLHL